jgi:crossover junction endodeoxyribonuclease RusA
VQIEFPVEFIVHGTPVSMQAKRAASREEWKLRIRSASSAAIPSPHFASEDRIAVTIYYLPALPMQGDIDNIVKPILDALAQHIYIDDKQVELVVVQKFEGEVLSALAQPSPTLAAAVQSARPVLYVRVSNDPFEELS